MKHHYPDEDKAKLLVETDLKEFYTDLTNLVFGEAEPYHYNTSIWYVRGSFQSSYGGRDFTYELNTETKEFSYRSVRPTVKVR